ncbi:hypothetical protein FDB42_11785 [Clostridium botulinum]|nr:hypothetical protein [Clostridium botulinum]
MSRKILKCYECDIMKDDIKCKKNKIGNVLDCIFNPKINENVTELDNGNTFLNHNSEKGDRFSLELLKKINNEDIDEKYRLFRIGKQKDMQDMLKRDKTTLLGEGVLDEQQQKIYELEVCTYILVDIENGIIMEMYGQYAPTIKMLVAIINNNLGEIKELKDKKVSFYYKKIMTSKMIETFKTTGNRLGKIGYTYSIPSAEKLKEMKLDTKQIEALKEIGGLEIGVIIKGKPRIPITKNKQRIELIVDSFKGCFKEIKESLFFEGSMGDGGSQKFTFNKEEVTYNTDITYHKKEDNLEIALNLEEIETQVYNKIKLKYENNKIDILKYILK